MYSEVIVPEIEVAFRAPSMTSIPLEMSHPFSPPIAEDKILDPPILISSTVGVETGF